MVTIVIVLALVLVVVRVVLKARANWLVLEAQARHRRQHRAIHHHRPVSAPRPVKVSLLPTGKPDRPAGFNPVRPVVAPTRRTRR